LTRLVLVQGENKRQTERSATPGPHRNADTEGEATKILLESQGYKAKSRVAHGQYEFACPFHEQDLCNAPFPRGHSTNFYVDRSTSKYFCQAASCGEKGNLATLEKYFGIANDPTAYNRYRTNEDRLREWEAQLPPGPRRQVFYDKGLRDDIINRFRFGYDQERAHYVLPYLEGRRPSLFRFYDPDFEKKHEQYKKKKGDDKERKPLKYWWEKGAESILFNATDAVGDAEGRVFICEGETKAALLCQLGYAAVGVPGANIWKDEWFGAFNHAREIFIIFDNDNPEFHHYGPCNKCGTKSKEECTGHNPGQDNALKLLDRFGYRAKNIVLPLEPDDSGMFPKKTDVNEYFTRDGKSASDFLELVFGEGEKHSPFLVRTLGEIRLEPPDEAVFLVEGLLPRAGRLLVSGAPKVGKSIYVENLALSIASGKPFLGHFPIAPSPNGWTDGHRVLLLDRELSERSLYDRLNALIAHTPGFGLADDKLLIDHRIQVRLDEPGATTALINLVRTNSADVIILDTAYKFFAGDLESSKSVKTALKTLDDLIGETECTVVLTHHHRKGQNNNNKGKEEAPHPDQVVGSFLWTGWPNGTVLLNFLNRRVESPFNTVSSFVAFRDCAPPEPLALYRGRDSIAYTSIVPHSFDSDEDVIGSRTVSGTRPFSYEELANALLEYAPITEENFIDAAHLIFHRSKEQIRFQLLDIADRHPDFVREGNGSRDNPYIWKYKHEVEEEPYVEPELELG
jgi:hypothetical protein